MMRFGSVCSGIEAASVAWKPLGGRCSFMSEIEAFPRAVLKHHYPDVPLHGDFTTIQAGEYEPIDVLVGGTPCQSFSVAGLRGGLADERGNLALEYLCLADRLRPRWLVWENVPGVLSSGGGRDFGAFLGGLVELGYGFAYRVLDAQFFGLAQRRKRVFVVGHLGGDWRRAAAVLFEPASLRGNSPPRREAGKGVAATLTRGAESSGRGGYAGRRREDDVNLIARTLNAHPSRIDGESETFVTHSLRARSFNAGEDGTGRGTPLVPVCPGGDTSKSYWKPTDVANAVTASQMPWQGTRIAYPSAAVRRLTPTECERLQGFPDNHTAISYRGKPAADGPRYKALGNSMAVPVVRWIGKRMRTANP